MVARTQVTLDSDAHRRAKARAHELGISFAEYVRRLVAADLGDVPSAADPSEVFDLGASGGSDVARHKDAYLGDAASAALDERRAGG